MDRDEQEYMGEEEGDEGIVALEQAVAHANLPNVELAITETISFQFSSPDVEQNFVSCINGYACHEEEEACAHLVHDVKELSPDVYLNLSTGIVPGEMLPPLELKLLDHDGQEASLDVLAADQEVVLLDIWTSECEPCLEALSQYDQLLQDHPEWGEGRVRILTLNIDATPEEGYNVINTLGCTLCLNAWGDAGTCQETLSINSLPCWFLVRQGQVIWRGHHAEIDLEATISSLLQGEDAVVKVTGNEEGVGQVEGLPLLQTLSDDEMLHFLGELQEKVAATQVPPSASISCVAENITTMSATEGTVKNRRLIVTGNSNEEQYVHELLDWIKGSMGGNVFISFSD